MCYTVRSILLKSHVSQPINVKSGGGVGGLMGTVSGSACLSTRARWTSEV